MVLTASVRSVRPSAVNLVVSLLITGLGWLSGQALNRIDQDLRIMDAEYTIGTTDLAYISADVMRYQSPIVLAPEANSHMNFEQITESLSAQRARIEYAVYRYATAGLRVSRSGRSEPKDKEGS